MIFHDIQHEYIAYVDGELIEKQYGSTIGKVRSRLRYLLMKHNKLVFYQIFKLSHRNYGTERRSIETGWVDLSGKFNKTTCKNENRKKKPSTTSL
jgi:hypothetical protein